MFDQASLYQINPFPLMAFGGSRLLLSLLSFSLFPCILCNDIASSLKLFCSIFIWSDISHPGAIGQVYQNKIWAGTDDETKKAQMDSHIGSYKHTTRQGKHINATVQEYRLKASRKDWLQKSNQGELSWWFSLKSKSLKKMGHDWNECNAK